MRRMGVGVITRPLSGAVEHRSQRAARLLSLRMSFEILPLSSSDSEFLIPNSKLSSAPLPCHGVAAKQRSRTLCPSGARYTRMQRSEP
jgi:hypothetical protein